MPRWPSKTHRIRGQIYLEKILKGSAPNVWVRNVQLSFFSLVPAALPVIISPVPGALYANFSFTAWATIGIQVVGGLLTAVV